MKTLKIEPPEEFAKSFDAVDAEIKEIEPKENPFGGTCRSFVTVSTMIGPRAYRSGHFMNFAVDSFSPDKLDAEFWDYVKHKANRYFSGK